MPTNPLITGSGSDRECGACSLCCKLLTVTELQKPMNVWCRHFVQGVGCSIHGQPDMPPSCSDFMCGWRLSSQLFPGDSLRPDRCKFVVVFAASRDAMIVHVDPGYPHAWRKYQEYFSGIAEKLPVFLVIGNKRMGLGPKAYELANAAEMVISEKVSL